MAKKNKKLNNLDQDPAKNRTPEQLEKMREEGSLWLEEYISIHGFNKKHISSSYIDKIAREYVKWIEDNPKDIRISKFYQGKGIPKRTFFDWTEKYGPLKSAHEYAYEVIADRREDLAVNCSPTIALKIMPYYSDVWKGIEEWRAKMRSAPDESSGPRVVVMSELDYKSYSEGGNSENR